MNLHPKLKDLKLRATPYTKSSMSIDAKGKLNDDNTVEGYCCVWGVRDDRGTGWLKGCFAKSIQERGPKSSSKLKIIALWAHDQRQPLGQVIELEEDDYGLRFKIKFDDIPFAQDKLKQIRSGTINQFSFGFDYIWDQMYYDEKTDTIWVKESSLFEISPCSIASISETYAFRSKEDFDVEKDQLDSDTDEIIKLLPRGNQLEVRQLIHRHISLVRAEPLEIRSTALDSPEPEKTTDEVDFSLLIKSIF